MTKPKLIQLSSKDQQDLVERIKTATLTDNDKEILTGLIEFNSWLQSSLHEKSISINRLQNLFFGNNNEKANRNKKNKETNSNSSTQSDNQSAKNEADADINKQEPDTENTDTTNSIKKGVNSGKLSHLAYTNADYITLTTSHSVGDLCPQDCCNGKLTILPPGIVVKITGQGFAKVTKYSVQKLRCNLCGVQINANIPDNICNNKYDATFKAQLCMLKYYMGMPLYRIQGYQAALGVPLPNSTQWDLIDEVANDVHPAFKYLEVLASKGDLLHSDDTSVKILANIIASSNLLATNKERKGAFTTGILSYLDNNKIYLFYSGKKHAGENMHALLKQRSQELPTPKYMCDALSRNIPAELKHILINCLAHGRRKFVEIADFYPPECEYVVNLLSVAYANDAHTKEQKMDVHQRLDYHKVHSQSAMDTLYVWLQKQLDEHLVEANSSLGKAIKYMLKHWTPLTQFLRIAGAPLDNNILEQALKIPIRIRKNSMFFATEHGAYVGSMLLSLICTCIAAKQNPVEYLTALQTYKPQVVKEPHLWMPWNYKNSILDHQMAA